MSKDPFEGYPRVPRTDASGIQIGVGGNPPDRKYPRVGAVDTYLEAAKNYVARKKGEMPVIAGGVDDEDSSLYDKRQEASPFAKMHVAQSSALTEEDVRELKSKAARKGVGDAHVETVEVGSPSPKPAEPSGPPAAVVSGVGEHGRQVGGAPDGFTGQPQADPFMPEGMASFDKGDNQFETRVVYRDRIVERPVERIVEKPVEKIIEKVVEKDPPGAEWLKNRVRVQIGTSETTFNISAIAVLQSVNGVTVILPTANDAMTFVPRTGARVTVSSKATGVVKTMFTGVSFDIEELGIFGLCFFVPPDGDASKKADDDDDVISRS